MCMATFLGYLDLVSLVRTSGYNSVLRKHVYDYDDEEYHYEELWRNIDFTKVPKLVAKNITDRQLKALHARDRCQVIKVQNCLRVSRAGIEPLFGSTCLQEAHLRLGVSLWYHGGRVTCMKF
jgi:hypothetical protein